MRATDRRLVGLLAAVALSGCAHAGPLPASVAHRLHTVAIIARRAGPPVAYVARGDAIAARRLGGTPVEADGRIEGALDRAVTVYELEQLVRGAVVSHLHRPPFAIADPLKVSSALGSLLARGRALDVSRLGGTGIDAALVFRIVKWGVRKDGALDPGGFWMVVDARLVKVPGGAVLWSARVSVNRSEHPEGADGRFRIGAYERRPRQVLRVGLAEVADAVGARIARLVAGRRIAGP